MVYRFHIHPMLPVRYTSQKDFSKYHVTKRRKEQIEHPHNFSLEMMWVSNLFLDMGVQFVP